MNIHNYINRLSVLLLILLGGLSVDARPIKVACIGNSVTAGYLLKDPNSESYPAVLQRLLGEQYEVRNFGHSGATLLSKGHRPYIKTKEFQKAIDWNADIFIIHLGLNDTDPRNWRHYSSEFISDYNKLIDTLTHNNTAKRVLIAQMSPITSGHPRFTTGTRDDFDAIQIAIQKVAKDRRLELINLSTPLYNYPHLLPDALHPNREGAERMARYVHHCLMGTWGGLYMSPYYADGMVLQRGKRIRISGRADVGARVSISVDKSKIYLAVANIEGRWSALIDSLSTSTAHSLTIQAGEQSLHYDDVLVGDVWLASGQSNMAMTLGATEDSRLNGVYYDEKLRYYAMQAVVEPYKGAWSEEVLDKVNNLQYYTSRGWSQATKPEVMKQWSAVAYHFARVLRNNVPDIPIAIVANPLGGSPLESWVSQRTLEHQFPEILTDWLSKEYIMDWVRERASENIAYRPQGQRHPYEPAYLYAQAVEPLKGLGFKGVIWYQGESNADNLNLYAKLFPMMVDDWRNLFGLKLPFYTVQLPGIETRPNWSNFRMLQSDLTSSSVGGRNKQEGIYIVPSYDVADRQDVHPKLKAVIGERLAKQALTYTYDFPTAYEQTQFHTITLSQEGKRYYLCSETGYIKHNGNTKQIKGFEFAYEDKIYFPVEVERDRSGRLYIRTSIGTDLRYFRYAYQPYTEANLRNALGIPALPSVGAIEYADDNY